MYVIAYKCSNNCLQSLYVKKELFASMCKRINCLLSFPLKSKASPLGDFYKFSYYVIIFHIFCNSYSLLVRHEILPFSFLAFLVEILILKVAQWCPNFQVNAIQIDWVVDALFVDKWLSLFRSYSIWNKIHSIWVVVLQ